MKTKFLQFRMDRLSGSRSNRPDIMADQTSYRLDIRYLLVITLLNPNPTEGEGGRVNLATDSFNG